MGRDERSAGGAGALLAQRGPSLGPRGPVGATTSPAGGGSDTILDVPADGFC